MSRIRRVDVGPEKAPDPFSSYRSEWKIEDPVEIAKRIKVDVQKVEVPSSFLSSQVEHISKLTIFPFDELDLGFARMDATEYQFWLRRGPDPVGFYICLQGEVYGEGRRPHPLVQWMNETKAIVEKYSEHGELAK